MKIGAVAQLIERLIRIEGVEGLVPSASPFESFDETNSLMVNHSSLGNTAMQKCTTSHTHPSSS